MESLILQRSGFAYREQPIPEPKKGQALIQTLFVNTGAYRHFERLGVQGIQGIGKVIKSGLPSSRLDGQLVTFIQLDPDVPGCFSQYALCSSRSCIPLKDFPAPLEHFYLYSPLMTMLIVSVLKGHRSLVHVVRDVELGLHLAKYCRSKGIECLSVADPDQAAALTPMGFLCLSPRSLTEQVTQLSAAKGIRLVIDGHGGQLSSLVFQSMPAGALCFTYSAKSMADISPSELIFKGKQVRGLSLQHWYSGLSMSERYKVHSAIESNYQCFLPTKCRVFSHRDISEALEYRKQDKLATVLLSFKGSKSLTDALASYKSPRVEEIEQALQPFKWGPCFSLDDFDLILTGQGIYRGELSNNLPDGRGAMYYPDGSVYLGAWSQGRRHGKGRFMTPESWYEGEWADNCKEGFGALKVVWKSRFSGTFVRDQLVKGTEVTESEEQYTGDFSGFKREGQGKLDMKGGVSYEGAFLNGQPNGAGVVTYRDRKEFRGQFEGGKGTGVMAYQDGTRFYGSVVGFLEEGEGIIESSSGDRLQITYNQGKIVVKKPQISNQSRKTSEEHMEADA